MPENINNNYNNKDSAFVNDKELYGKNTEATPKPAPEIGVDLNNTVYSNIVNVGLNGGLDLSAIESFTQVSQSRESIYQLIDTMCQDSRVSAVLETYAEDATETNDKGKVVWVESNDENVGKYVTFLLDSLNVDKNSYEWVSNLCKYGDLYLRLYRESDYDDDILKKDLDGCECKDRKKLNEDVNIIAYGKNDKYVHYVERVANPAEIFELTKFNKTYAYIKANVQVTSTPTNNLQNTYLKYSFNRNDVELHGPMDYVHASLSDGGNRSPEEVKIFTEKTLEDDNCIKKVEDKSTTYKVRRGQSLLYDVFKVWRELALLENSVLLNRLTKSAIVRILSVEVGDMPKEQIAPHLQGIKSLIEQKSALNVGNSMTEYTNPGPVENNIYIPTHDGKGAISTDQIGGDVNVGQLTDLDYFLNKFYGSLRVPKQYFSETSDAAGFSGGQSLAIISSRYAKMVKRLQNTYLQALTDLINLMLIDKGLDSYINKFTLRMQAPTTQEEIDRRENKQNKIGIVRDLMDMLSEITDPKLKLEALKSLLSEVVTNNDLLNVIQKQIDELEKEGVTETSTEDSNDILGDLVGSEPTENTGFDLDAALGLEETPGEENMEETEVEEPTSNEEQIGELPTPEQLGIGDLTDNNNPEL